MRKICLLLLVLCLGFAASSFAATVQSPTVSVTISTVQDLAIDSLNVTIPAPSVADYNAGNTQTASNVLTVKSNVPWELKMRAISWSKPNEKPLSDLKWKRQGSAGDFNAFTFTDDTVFSGAATSGTVITVDYLMKLFWEADEPGVYSADLTYTLVTGSSN